MARRLGAVAIALRELRQPRAFLGQLLVDGQPLLLATEEREDKNDDVAAQVLRRVRRAATEEDLVVFADEGERDGCGEDRACDCGGAPDLVGYKAHLKPYLSHSTFVRPTRMQQEPLKIVVVGAGLVGLATAVALRRQGHCVEIYESSSFKTELGAGLAVPSNTLRSLVELGCIVKNLDPVENLCFTSMAYDGSATGMRSDQTDYEARYGTPWVMAHRVDLHTELLRMATDDAIPGPPAKLFLNHRVVSCDAGTPSITLATGMEVKADLIVGADGIRSTLRETVLGGKDIIIPPSRTAGFRWMVDASALEPYPELDWIVNARPLGARLISAPMSPDSQTGKPDHRTIILYACRGGSLINAIGMHDDTRDQDAIPWNVPVSRDDLFETYRDYHPRFQRLLALAPEDGIHIWQMRVVPPLPTWVRGRICLAGDAAHASLPTMGQGFGQGLEDAVALATLLPLGTHIGRISGRLAAYETLRKDRAEWIARESYEQQAVKEKRGVYLRSLEMRDAVMGYNIREEAERVLCRVLAQEKGEAGES